MALVVVDTDILIDYSRQAARLDPVLRELMGDGMLAITAISVFELEQGFRRPEDRIRLSVFLEALPILQLDKAAAVKAGEVSRALAATGQNLALGDLLIAGIVLSHSGILLTRNIRHFSRIPGLRLFGPE
ncbi:MAG: type II toxin-antitoxin system VapC family toxin [Acidobacteria bacterium]|nr:type II toxin-antitoxin system VapC family toxin [Acidobacteriota bacterium]